MPISSMRNKQVHRMDITEMTDMCERDRMGLALSMGLWSVVTMDKGS